MLPQPFAECADHMASRHYRTLKEEEMTIKTGRWLFEANQNSSTRSCHRLGGICIREVCRLPG